MFNSIRYLISDIAYWLRGNAGRPVLFVLGLLVLAAAAFGVYSLFDSGSSNDSVDVVTTPAPPAEIHTHTRVVEPADLGFPSFATRNTTRVGGSDPIADAAGVALATFPASGTGEGPTAVSIVDVDDWAGAIAASSLVAEPERIPIIFSDGGQVPELSANALETLAPKGSPATDEAQAFQVGQAPAPDGLKSKSLGGTDDAAATAAAIAAERAKLTGKDPEHVMVVGLDDPAYAMPAASWAARSGDPVLFTDKDSVPAATTKAINKFPNVTVYVLGPESTVSAKAFDELKDSAVDVRRVGADGPVENSIAFARYADGDFGWNINDPGHGFVIANADRPSDAGAASGLSGSGTWGPLLVTDDAKELPKPLAGYLLDLKPGYTDDPTRAVYNHVWVMGDEDALSVAAQAEVDDLAEVAKVSSDPSPASAPDSGQSATPTPTPAAPGTGGASPPGKHAGSQTKTQKDTKK